MLLPILYYGNPLLRKKAELVKEITPEILRFIKDLGETMDAKNGLGISATQVGKLLSICIIRPPIEDENGRFDRAPAEIFINPRLSNPSKEGWVHEEACLSIPKVYGEVERPGRITVTALDISGKEFTKELEGWPARVLMHENDHLNGVLFIDRLSAKRRNEIESRLQLIKKTYPS